MFINPKLSEKEQVMDFSMDMNNEKAPSTRKLLPEGKREFQIVSVEERTSKSGNKMFVVGLSDKETKYVTDVYLVAEQGKRWALKQLLTACGCEAGQDGVYNWGIRDILDKHISADVEHEDNEFINRQGEKVTTKQHRIVNFNVSHETGWDG